MEELIIERITEKMINAAPDKHYTVILDFFDSPINFERISASLNNFSQLQYNTIVLALTNCPEDAGGAPPNSFTAVSAREDLKTYFKVKEDFPSLKYGDYTVRLKPEFENKHINYYNTYIKLFYSSEDDYYIGKSTLLRDKGIETFVDICQEIVDSDVYKNPSYSHGDKAIMECAEGELEISNHSKPIEYGINHHIELTSRQL